MNIIWSCAIVIFIITEAATVGLASIWFAVGSLFALIASVLGAQTWLQILVFVLVSGATLALTRPLVKKHINNKSQPTNADRLIGTTCLVTETIDNLAGTGTVSAGGKLWTARSNDGSVIESETLVIAEKIEGVKLIVASKQEATIN